MFSEKFLLEKTKPPAKAKGLVSIKNGFKER